MFKLNEFLWKFTSECLETLAIVSYDLLVVVGLIALVLSVFIFLLLLVGVNFRISYLFFFSSK